MKKRLPFLIVLGLGFVLWRGGFGFLAIERTITWRLPVSYGEVRRLELQVWRGDALLGRQDVSTPGGLSTEPTLKLPLERGMHRALASAWLSDAGTPVTFQQDFDPGADTAVVLELKKKR